MSQNITSQSQVLNVTNVTNATKYLGDSMNYINEALENLQEARTRVGKNFFTIDDKNLFETPIDNLCAALSATYDKISTAKANIESDARTYNTSEQNQYNQYKNSQDNATADTTSTSSGGSFGSSGTPRGGGFSGARTARL